MLETLKAEVARHGDRAAFLNIDRLQDLQQDVQALRGRENLNNFQRFITADLYSFALPEVDYPIRSILVVAAPDSATIDLRFYQDGKTVLTSIPTTYTHKDSTPLRVGGYLKEFLNPQGYHVVHAPKMPHKLTAVRSGLGRYGRNNICYVEGMGSFINLNVYFTDIPCPEDGWQEIRSLDLCHTCKLCQKSCPTGAILPERFLIDNERCLTYFNEAGEQYEFPDWIEPSVHHTIYGCLRCQMACPANRAFANTRSAEVDFSEAETAMLMHREPFESFPQELQEKVQALEMVEYLGAVPRNLRALFAKDECRS
jgi:epoxyqueuosine reductase